MRKYYLYDRKYIYYPDCNQLIEREVDNIFRKYKEERKIEVSADNFEAHLIKKRVVNLKQIIFEVTQLCNLRCKYCIYGNAFNNYRNHSTLPMPFEIALKGMQYIYDLKKKREDKNLFLSFYGGEPTAVQIKRHFRIVFHH